MSEAYCSVYELDPGASMPIPAIVLVLGGVLLAWAVITFFGRRYQPDHPGFSKRRVQLFWSVALPSVLAVGGYSCWREWRSFSDAAAAVQGGAVRSVTGIAAQVRRQKTSVTFEVQDVEFRVDGEARVGATGYDDYTQDGAIQEGRPLRVHYVDIPFDRVIVGVDVPDGDPRCPGPTLKR